MNRFQFALVFGTAVAAVSCSVRGKDALRERADDLAPPVRIEAGGEPIEVGGFAAPFVGDFDGDGKHDLLVGQYRLGRMRVYRNIGSNARPEFNSFEWFSAGGRIAGVPQCCQAVFTPQLVDFDGDGRTDVLTGSGYSGEVFLYRRTADGTFDDAEVLENSDGHVQMHRCMSTNSVRPREYNVTALAYDWDNDGDNDLLLGHSPICLVLNHGTSGDPSYDAGRLIECDGERIMGGVGSPHMADWDGDGLDDLVCSARRDVVWYRNVGKRGRPKFEPPRLLVPLGKHSPGNGDPGDQPGSHHAFCVADFNSDGRLDLLLGDRFRIDVQVTQQELEQAAKDRERRDAFGEEYRSLSRGPANETRTQRIDRYRKRLHAWQECAALNLTSGASSGTRSEHRGFVWFFERVPAKERKETSK